MQKDIIVHCNKDGSWIAYRKGGDRVKGAGPSSVEAHGNLLEREAPSPKKRDS